MGCAYRTLNPDRCIARAMQLQRPQGTSAGDVASMRPKLGAATASTAALPRSWSFDAPTDQRNMVQLDDVDRHGMDHDISMHPEAVQLKRAICYPSTGIQPMRYAGAQLPRVAQSLPHAGHAVSMRSFMDRSPCSAGGGGQLIMDASVPRRNAAGRPAPVLEARRVAGSRHRRAPATAL